MPRVIGILNFKGGTAKTTTAVNLAGGLALRGSRVLGIDLDSQGGFAMHLGVRSKFSLSDLVLNKADRQQCIIHARKSLDLIPSDVSLRQVEGVLWQLSSRELVYSFLADRLQDLAERYDYVVIDYSPASNLLGESALYFTKELIVPVAMNYLALVGTRQVVETLKSIGQMPGHTAQLFCVLPTFFNARSRIDNEVVDILHRYFPGQVAEPIRWNSRLAESPGQKKTIFEYAPTSSGAIDYARLVERVSKHA